MEITEVSLINGNLCYETSEGGGGYIPVEKILQLATIEAKLQEKARETSFLDARTKKLEAVATESKTIIEGIHNKLGVATTTQALQMIDRFLALEEKVSYAIESYAVETRHREGQALLDALTEIEKLRG